VLLHQAATINPQAKEIIGLDSKADCIAQAQEKIRQQRLYNCKAVVTDLEDTKGYPPGPFDMIVISDQINYLSEPEELLVKITELLDLDGVIGIVFHNKKGWWFNECIAQALHEIEPSQENQENLLEVLQNIILNAQPNSYLGQYAKNLRFQPNNDSISLNHLLSREHKTYTIREIPNLLSKCNLTFLDVVPGNYALTPEKIVCTSSSSFYERYNKLDRINQLSVLSLLNPLENANIQLWACHHQSKQWQNDISFMDDHWIVNPLFISHAKLKLVGENTDSSIEQYCGEKLLTLPNQFKIQWRLANTQENMIAMTLNQFQILVNLINNPKTGEDMLKSSTHPGREDWMIKKITELENMRILLRVPENELDNYGERKINK
jgi:hypothetical protein